MRGRFAQTPNTRQVAFRLPVEIADRVDKIKQSTGASTTTEVIIGLLHKALDMKTVREKLDSAKS